MGHRRDRRHHISNIALLLLVAAFLLVALPALSTKAEAASHSTETGIPGPVEVGVDEPIVPRNDLSNGGELYRSECAACHAATAIGGALSFRDNVPSLKNFTPLQVAAAIRSGPGEMPFFGPDSISDEQLQQIVTYVLYLQTPDDLGGAPITRVGPVMEGLVAWAGAMSAIVIGLMWIGDRRA